MKGYQKSAFASFSMLFFIFSMNTFGVQAQSKISFKPIKKDFIELKNSFELYHVYAFDHLKLKEKARSVENTFEFILGNESFIFTLDEYDLRSPDYKLVESGKNGTVILPRTKTVTYRGYTEKSNREVRFTITEDFISGFIETPKGKLFIESLHHFSETEKSTDKIVAYYEKDTKTLNFGECATGHKHTTDAQKEIEKNISSSNRSLACKEVQVALAADFDMVQDHGGTAAGVEAHMLSVLNLVETNYDDEFADDLQFQLAEVFASTCNTCDPWSSSNNIEVVLSSFRMWGPTGFSNTHDVATLWSPRNFTHPDVGDGVIGLAYIGVICTSFRYNVCEDFTNNDNFLRILQAHEMGHNFNADHDGQNSETIMAPSVVNTTTWSSASINDINDHIADIECLGPCSSGVAPTAGFSADELTGCIGATIQFNNESTDNPSTYLWTFEGGNPASSTQANPSITYNSTGLFSVTLEVTNNFGSDEIIVNEYIEIFEEPIADFTFTQNNLQVNFNNLSENFTEVDWDFGDGFNSSAINPTHIYDEDGSYTVILTISSACGDENFTDIIEIITAPTADFSFDQNEGCTPFTVQFFEQASTNVDAYNWTFEGGNPSTSNASNPMIVYDQPGVYDVSLVVINDAGEDEIIQANAITVLAQPLSDFDFSISDLTITLNATLGNNSAFLWDFGDGDTASNPDVSHTYADGGTYTVTLTTTNACGSDVSTQTLSLNAAPAASYASNIQSGCAPFQVQFESTSTGEIDQISWIFQGGNPAISTIPNPVVTYNNAGNYDVTLTVTNSIGTDEIISTDYISVMPATVSDFSFAPLALLVSFSNLSANADEYEWLFGDGSSSVQINPNHTYSSDGVYEVSLIVNGDCGPDTSYQIISLSTPPTAAFSVPNVQGCAPFSVQFQNNSSANASSYLWEFEGGNPSNSTAANPTITYTTTGTYNVKLTAVGPGGSDVEERIDFITILPEPNADFSILGVSDNDVSFQNESENAISYFWDFGDGMTSNLENPIHTYAILDSYMVTLTVTNACGQDVFTQTIQLSSQPIAQFSVADQTGCVPFTVSFEDHSINNPTSWLWSFEGGIPATSTAQNPTITYSSPGSYDVSLMAENAIGSNVQTTLDYITIIEKPESGFSFQINSNEVSFLDGSAGANAWSWDFGNGQMSALANPVISFDSPGNYEVVLIVSNECGADTISKIVAIMTTGLDDLEVDNWKLFPNPANQFLVLEGNLSNMKGEVLIMNILGQKVKAFNVDQLLISDEKMQMDVSDLKNGLYYLILQNESQPEIFEVLIQK